MSIEGYYVRVEGFSAEVAIKKARLLPDERYFVEGTALWEDERPYGPNLGFLEFTAAMDNNEIVYSEPGKPDHTLRMRFLDNDLIIEEENAWGVYGANVSFEGTYRKVPAMLSIWKAMFSAVKRLFS
ncbi:hypothetical protein [Brucella pseudogrignonensis]|uniref:hypothetical protein n=1 Tax=Brucella pseudogrignonensis TaxID=419475 RepID=UPI000CFDEFA4|nr:hypothetical protein [Brucella pseudogrignonensis]MQP39617.1 hypothetical protein [Ochrobactrum sp. MYb237]